MEPQANLETVAAAPIVNAEDQPPGEVSELAAGKMLSFVTWYVGTRFGRKSLDVIYETGVMLLYIGAIKLLDTALTHWIGKDATFWNALPIRYIIDTGHAIVIAKFFLEIIRDFFGKKR